MRSLAGVARRVAGGNMGARAEVTGSSEQREVAAAFNVMTDRLSRSLAAQREFVSNASHQLRTPLTGLRLRIEAAGRKSADEGVRRDLEAAEHEADRLAGLLRGLLVLAREEEPPSERPAEHLGGCVAAALERWRAPAAQTGHSLAADGDDDLLVAAGTEDLGAILDNLIENALNYSPAGGAVEVRWQVEGDSALLAVLDRGPGIRPGEEEALFERFQRGQAAGGTPGTGLGLAIVEKLAGRWDGAARLRNREGGGAAAEVRLPLARDAGARDPQPSPLAGGAP
jgi:signal transduction histidine kinase